MSAKYFIAGAVAASTTQPIDFATKDWDTHGSVTTGSSWKFTAPISGIYEIGAALASDNATNTNLDVYKNGNLNTTIGTINNTAFTGASTKVNLLAGQYIDLRTAASRNINATTTQAITIDRVGNY